MASSPPHSIGVAVVCERVGHPRLNYDRSNASGVTSKFLTSTAPKFCVIDCSGIRRTSMRKATFFATALRLSGARRYARRRLHIVSCPDRLLRPLPLKLCRRIVIVSGRWDAAPCNHAPACRSFGFSTSPSSFAEPLYDESPRKKFYLLRGFTNVLCPASVSWRKNLAKEILARP